MRRFYGDSSHACPSDLETRALAAVMGRGKLTDLFMTALHRANRNFGADAGDRTRIRTRRLRYSCGMSVDLTAVFKPVPEGFVAFVEELPGANAQGATLEEARANLQEAVTLVLQANRDLAEEELASSTVIRERFRLSA